MPGRGGDKVGIENKSRRVIRGGDDRNGRRKSVNACTFLRSYG